METIVARGRGWGSCLSAGREVKNKFNRQPPGGSQGGVGGQLTSGLLFPTFKTRQRSKRLDREKNSDHLSQENSFFLTFLMSLWCIFVFSNVLLIQLVQNACILHFPLH